MTRRWEYLSTPRDDDESWLPDWRPTRYAGDEPLTWEDLPEGEIMYHRFLVDTRLVVDGCEMSAIHNPLLDFALAWVWIPHALPDVGGRVEADLTMQAHSYFVENLGDEVAITSTENTHRAVLPHDDFRELVDHMVTSAFELLYSRHPVLRGNHFLRGLRRRMRKAGYL
ncbi:hypothetical protein LX16_0303 [Stackebrandtia albiflava]|uniref:Uncharacterized protein n=1 Tax=Stackebrandtia albiflava TaxID=406432 RepID=A0A562V9U4_9ACTN|nr:hypothetical protein [Stackebrandtia albiflava]TWJ14618.1 hypothetical protein LX16_0303 [Stackebrandtia albiflava]